MPNERLRLKTSGTAMTYISRQRLKTRVLKEFLLKLTPMRNVVLLPCVASKRELLYSPKKKRSHSSFYLKLSAIGFPKSKEIITIFINWHLPNSKSRRSSVVFTLSNPQTHLSKLQQHLESAPKHLDLGLDL